MAKSVNDYLAAHDNWMALLAPLRRMMLETGLTETVKWGAPVYTLDDGYNVVGLGAFKQHAGIWFFDGAFLTDPERVLVNAQEGKTRGMRQWRFERGEAAPLDLVRKYVEEAIANARAGKRTTARKKPALELPAEFEEAFGASEGLKAAFEALTPGRQREYVEYIASAKRAETRARRLEKITPMIVAGHGLNDKYRTC